MSRRWLRRTAALAAALLAGLGLAACSSEEVEEQSYSAIRVNATMPKLDGVVELDSADEFIEVPGARFQVTSVAALNELPESAASQYGAALTAVRAPQGEDYYLAEIRVSEPQSFTVESGETHSPQTSFVVEAFGETVDRVEGCWYAQSCLVIVTGPEGAQPDDISFTAVMGDVPQRLSLVNGEATSELTYLPKMHAEYDPVWWEFEGDPELEEETVGGYVSAVFWTPLVEGLPAPGADSIYVGVDIEAIEQYYVEDTSEVWLSLEDGTLVESANSFYAAFDEEDSVTWFVVPADTVEFSFEMMLSTNNEHRGDATQPVTFVVD